MRLSQSSAHVRGVDEAGAVCLDQKATPRSLKRLLSNLPGCVVGMEDCGRAHQWGREIGRMEHEARLVATQFVKPFVMGNKNDRADAAAMQRPGMRYVGIKSEARQSQQALHRIRSLEPRFVDGLADLYDQLVQMDERIERLDQRIASADEQAKLLMTIPGIGPMTATALLCTAGDTGVFKNGREFSAWLGRVPRPHSTGGKDRLLVISKRGDVDPGPC